MGEGKRSALRVDFDGQIRLEFHGANVSSRRDFTPPKAENDFRDQEQ
jgi:hypothetical protein